MPCWCQRPEARTGGVFAGNPWSGGVEAFLEFWFQTENYPDKDLLAEIARLRERGYFIAVATNQEKHRVEFMQKTMQLGQHFDQIFTSCDIGYKKPETEFFNAVAEGLRDRGIERIVFFDDRIENVERARDAGWDSRLYGSIADFRNWAEPAERKGVRSSCVLKK